MSKAPVLTHPAAEYARRAGLFQRTEDDLSRRHRSLGYVRLLLVLVVLALLWHLWGTGWSRAWLWLLVPLASFVAVAMYHERVLRASRRARRAVEFYNDGLARIEDRWIGRHERSTHADLTGPSLYAADLDLVGRGSLFELLCTAQTSMGERVLLQWLLAPASTPEVLRRQAAVAELRDHLDLREALVLANEQGSIAPAAEPLLQWAEGPDTLPQQWPRIMALALAAVALAAIVLWYTRGPILPLVGVLAVEWLFARSLNRRLRANLAGVEAAGNYLQLYAKLLRLVEAETLDAPLLRTLQQKLGRQSASASQAIARLATLVQLQDSLDNLFMRLLNLPLLYSVQLAYAVQRWRSLHGAHVRDWLNALSEMEALLSLATYSYEHPDDPFPTIEEGKPSFAVEEMGHPLIPANKCVRNSVALGSNEADTRVLLISGSNMSGKSTLMRTAGVNLVLALCGAPVRCRSMRLTPLRLAASLLVNDSLQAGHSRFYAEVERLQRICAMAENATGPRVLFLLDELLQGTNSKDRLTGAQGITRALHAAGAIGMITTHDLALSEMADAKQLGLRNVHFEDQIVDGRMQFDFELRDGIVTRSNGIELMRLIGLKV
ncbi:mismatch repair protein [Acidipila sp. EB88]|uniref:MutS-related protein n=1 Tax=Acidipila sp. EB88 TaxID=2305226 RepID=UPI000F5DC889|nr:mismatch repair protein [Acidipila sp. EB88]RRA47428.1 mismatch repair protein [Acidipila sp. EB88]